VDARPVNNRTVARYIAQLLGRREATLGEQLILEGGALQENPRTRWDRLRSLAGASKDVYDRSHWRRSAIDGRGHRASHVAEVPVSIDQARKYSGPAGINDGGSRAPQRLELRLGAERDYAPAASRERPYMRSTGIHRVHLCAHDQQLRMLIHRNSAFLNIQF
jgi:hypothetical protein